MLLLFFLTFFTIHTSELLQVVGEKDALAIKFFNICLELNKQFEVCNNEHVVLSDSDYEQLSLKLRNLEIWNTSIKEFMRRSDRRKYFSDSIEKLLIQGGINGDRTKLFSEILENNEDNIKKIKKAHSIFQDCFCKLVEACKNSKIDFSQTDKKDSLSEWFLKHIKSPFILVPLVCLAWFCILNTLQQIKSSFWGSCKIT
jgi:hypothetical protein